MQISQSTNGPSTAGLSEETHGAERCLFVLVRLPKTSTYILNGVLCAALCTLLHDDLHEDRLALKKHMFVSNYFRGFLAPALVQKCPTR